MSITTGSVRDRQVAARRLVDAARRPLATEGTVGVWGVKGGVGTTTIALLLASCLARHREDPVTVVDPTLYGSLPIRLGLPLPLDAVARPGDPPRPGLLIGTTAPTPGLHVIDAPAAVDPMPVEVLVVSATVDAVLMADGHAAPLVALTQQTPRPGLDIAAAVQRLGRDARVVAVPFDPHLVVGGPVDWDRLAAATRDAVRQLAAAVITQLSLPDPTATE